MTKEEGEREQYLSELILQELSKIISSNEAEIALLKKKLEDIRYATLSVDHLSTYILQIALIKASQHHLSILDPGQTYFFSPKPDTNITTVKVSTNEGIVVQSNYRSPTKGLGLPGSGR